MGRLWLIGAAAAALFALGAMATTAGATTPAALLLSGNVSELEAKLTGTSAKLETVGAKSITASSVEAELHGCEALEKKLTDTNLCKDVPVSFKGTKKGTESCRSENAKGEKDAAETVLALLDLHLDSELVSVLVGKVLEQKLEPLLVSKVLGTALEEEVTVLCGGSLKEKIKGRIGCLLLPGLKNISTSEKLTVDCKMSKGVQEIGTCIETKTLCEELEKDPFQAELGSSGFENAALELHLEGSPSKDLFIDD